ncbi:hypothetical protein [Modicisalibacter tunisiensis]|uniref:Uncharacterized protein n=2 Tax=Modicisalibacter tunisiensis TaxID=390637 RepID=A0ABS7WY06_9GAMM|nr:hypothetical protein [Modicisalibacter tunisiensis]MBZ9567512.1 hypothetical protein [Modicisalibacter tunisiensis]
MGPYYEKDGVVNMGVACHIYSASKNGPRGQGGKSEEFISSEKNGIWCCQYHGALIDKNKGGDYPAEVLFAWKELAEARVRKQMNDSPSPLGWVESIELTSFPILSPLPKINLYRNTLMWGKHGSGKTSLLEIAASVTNSCFAERFVNTKRLSECGESCPATISGKVVYSTVDNFDKEIFVEVKGPVISRCDGSRTYLLPPGDLEIIYCSFSNARKQEGEDDVDFFMRALGVDRSALYSLCDIGTKTIIPGDIRLSVSYAYDDENDKEYIERKSDGEPCYNIEIKVEGREFYVTYNGLSGSEKGRLIIDLMITKAREICKERLTLLLIEEVSYNFDESNFERLLVSLSKEDFQSVVLVPPARENEILDNSAELPSLRDKEYLRKWSLAVVGKNDC